MNSCAPTASGRVPTSSRVAVGRPRRCCQPPTRVKEASWVTMHDPCADQLGDVAQRRPSRRTRADVGRRSEAMSLAMVVLAGPGGTSQRHRLSRGDVQIGGVVKGPAADPRRQARIRNSNTLSRRRPHPRVRFCDSGRGIRYRLGHRRGPGPMTPGIIFPAPPLADCKRIEEDSHILHGAVNYWFRNRTKEQKAVRTSRGSQPRPLATRMPPTQPVPRPWAHVAHERDARG
jgi:hypothetical protein